MGPLWKDVCPALPVKAWLAEWPSCGVSVEFTGQACTCWRVGLETTLAFSSCVALVKSQAEFQGSHHVYHRSD